MYDVCLSAAVIDGENCIYLVLWFLMRGVVKIEVPSYEIGTFLAKCATDNE